MPRHIPDEPKAPFVQTTLSEEEERELMKFAEDIRPRNTALNLPDPPDISKLVKGIAFRRAVERIPGDLWLLDHEELTKKIKPTTTDYALRNSLWNELRLAMTSEKLIPQVRIYSGICSYTNWWNNILKKPTKLCWILFPSLELDVGLRALAEPLVNCIHDVLERGLILKDGSIDPKLIGAFMKLFGILADREHRHDSYSRE